MPYPPSPRPAEHRAQSRRRRADPQKQQPQRHQPGAAGVATRYRAVLEWRLAQAIAVSGTVAEHVVADRRNLFVAFRSPFARRSRIVARVVGESTKAATGLGPSELAIVPARLVVRPHRLHAPCAGDQRLLFTGEDELRPAVIDHATQLGRVLLDECLAIGRAPRRRAQRQPDGPTQQDSGPHGATTNTGYELGHTQNRGRCHRSGSARRIANDHRDQTQSVPMSPPSSIRRKTVTSHGCCSRGNPGGR